MRIARSSIALVLAANLSAGILACPAVEAYERAAASWPEQAQGRPVPRPSWILVIPASRDASGNLVVWDQADPWTKLWRVPQIIDGLRIVTLMGDSQDRRTITADAFDGMEIDPISRVMRKYGAPAIALAVDSGDSAAVAVYVPGHAASWEPVTVAVDEAATHGEAVRILTAMLTGRVADETQEEPPAEEEPAAPMGPTVRIEAWRPAEDGIGNEYRIGSDDPAGAVAALSSVPSVVVTGGVADGNEITIRYDGEPDMLEASLAAAGIAVQ